VALPLGSQQGAHVALEIVWQLGNSAFDKPNAATEPVVELCAMATTRSNYTVTNWAVGAAAFAVFGTVVVYLVLLTRPAGWNLGQWSILLLWFVVIVQIVLATRKRRRRQ
jgi:hypothetical protein